ncbi:MAG: class I SAM-dependent methyltransferase, partial [Capsulimonadaceae bacterium]
MANFKENPLARLISAGARNSIKTSLVRLGNWSNMLVYASPVYSSKIYPYAPGANEFVLPDTLADVDGKDGQGLAVPPPSLRIGRGSADDYLKSGEADVRAMVAILEGIGISLDSCERIMEYGCHTCRMLRWMAPYAAQSEVWGIDISTTHVYWSQRHLSPPFLFATVTTAPHLPFEDNSFDFIYAGSVFSHMDDLADDWFLEIRRVLRPGGILYATFLDSHSVAAIRAIPESDW